LLRPQFKAKEKKLHYPTEKAFEHKTFTHSITAETFSAFFLILFTLRLDGDKAKILRNV
jgi:membrane-bound metal-dependent hydrolase YbcI (DUF457 family)